MKHREEEFCRLTAALGDPREAARRAGYQHPDEAWQELIVRGDVAERVKEASQNARQILMQAARTTLYRMITANNADALRLLYRDQLSEEALAALNLSGVSEVKRTDKGVEIKFFDRLKLFSALDAPENGAQGGAEGGLIEAMRLSAKALSESLGGDADAV